MTVRLPDPVSTSWSRRGRDGEGHKDSCPLDVLLETLRYPSKNVNTLDPIKTPKWLSVHLSFSDPYKSRVDPYRSSVPSVYPVEGIQSTVRTGRQGRSG